MNRAAQLNGRSRQLAPALDRFAMNVEPPLARVFPPIPNLDGHKLSFVERFSGVCRREGMHGVRRRVVIRAQMIAVGLIHAPRNAIRSLQTPGSLPRRAVRKTINSARFGFWCLKRSHEIACVEGFGAVVSKGAHKCWRLLTLRDRWLIPSAQNSSPWQQRVADLATRYESLTADISKRESEPRVAQARTTREVEHLLTNVCRHCKDFRRERCVKLGPTAKELRNFARRLVDASGECPVGHWPTRRGPTIERLNLIYHVTPIRHSNDIWQWNIRQLLKRIHVFNGRRLVSICTPDGRVNMDPPEAVIEMLAGHGFEVSLAVNDPNLRETPHFKRAIRALASTNASEAFFFAHTKGVTRRDLSGVLPWTAAMYHHNLDRMDEVLELLRCYGCLGITKRYGDPPNFPARLARRGTELRGIADPNWHFSGTFFWVRHDALFGREGWDQIADHPYAVESYLSNHFSSHEAFCLAHDDCGDPYEAAMWGRDPLSAHVIQWPLSCRRSA